MIQVGQVLDKYELLERVGQGGMAIVYRGLDRTLKRTVAIKILHKHLSDYQEARDRFGREAQAVAKLRHENILEIFDYSAKTDEESYIVTEFIDGQTLKQFITERPIAFPEVGAMVIMQVCRALAHAHAVGILHRDIKPENIMIRSDGVVKLMDFGISHMVDLERLTVTGQLLGSPAYMAPEHVEGRPLDFRTDVFAAGIVLYQLCVGKLPFEGKNPHEVLKRIAECKFVDPRVANPRIGNRLGKIILRAMAAMPNDRYPAIGEMVIAIEKYLEESGLQSDKIAGELCRYFKAPGAYEQALRERLVDHLARRGKELLEADDRQGALDVFDRVLTIDPENAKVLALLDGINRRRRLRSATLAAIAIVAVGGAVFGIQRLLAPGPPEPGPNIEGPHPVVTHGPVTEVSHDKLPPLTDAAVNAPNDATQVAVAMPRGDGGRTVAPNTRDAGVGSGVGSGDELTPMAITIKVNPTGGTFQIDGGPKQPISGDTFQVTVVDKPIEVVVENPCCQAESIPLDRASPATLSKTLQLRPALIVPRCATPGAIASIDGRGAPLDQSVTIPFDKNATESTKNVPISFTDGRKSDSRTVRATAGKTIEVKCAL